MEHVTDHILAAHNAVTFLHIATMTETDQIITHVQTNWVGTNLGVSTSQNPIPHIEPIRQRSATLRRQLVPSTANTTRESVEAVVGCAITVASWATLRGSAKNQVFKLEASETEVRINKAQCSSLCNQRRRSSRGTFNCCYTSDFNCQHYRLRSHIFKGFSLFHYGWIC